MSLAIRPETGGAELDISVVAGADGRSRLLRHRVSYPWSLGRGYNIGPDARTAMVIPQIAGAGLLAGDSFRQNIKVDAGGALQLVSAGATLVHGASVPRASRSDWHYRIGAGASVMIASEPHVLMEGSDLDLRQDLVVDETSVVIASEAVIPAPGASNVSWRMRTTARRPDGTVVFRDVQIVDAAALARTRRLPGGHAACATVLVFLPRCGGAEIRCLLEERLKAAGAGIWGAIAALRGGAGFGGRLTAATGGQVRDAMIDLREHAGRLIGL